MQPLFAQKPLFQDVLLAGYVIWAVMEMTLGILQLIRLRTGARLQDKGSRVVLVFTLGLGISLCLLLPRAVPAFAITSASVFVFWFGIALVYAGLAFRLYAIIMLGRYFTPSVAVVADQQVVEDGPYKLIRHPSYTGLLIMFLGFGLSSTNWLSLLALMGCALIGLGYRIRVEERVLQEHLGQRYQEYMRRTKRLIPFVL
ncbi:MAG TPA: isoprenylcysteine carboxylmethyltransferase family protein [Ktedonosporobacter sp.]|nr:isoprenylcysteine carboxylmethyltransferase family protein [Ktedonosporobacter sp.]